VSTCQSFWEEFVGSISLHSSFEDTLKNFKKIEVGVQKIEEQIEDKILYLLE